MAADGEEAMVATEDAAEEDADAIMADATLVVVAGLESLTCSADGVDAAAAVGKLNFLRSGIDCRSF